MIRCIKNPQYRHPAKNILELRSNYRPFSPSKMAHMLCVSLWISLLSLKNNKVFRIQSYTIKTNHWPTHQPHKKLKFEAKNAIPCTLVQKKEKKKVIFSYKSTKICTKGKSFEMLNLGMISCQWQQKHKQQNNKWDTGPQKNEHFFCFIPLMSSVRKRDKDVNNSLLFSVWAGGGGMFQENSIKICILSRVKQITSPGWMHETSARGWCTGKTQRDRVEREVGEGIGMGNTCKPLAV